MTDRNQASQFKRFIFFAQYLLIRFISGVLNLLPFSLALGLARPASFLIFSFSGRSKRMALENLHKAFKSERAESEIEKIAFGSFQHLAEFGIEWLRMPKIIQNPNRYLTINHVEKIRVALQQKKGAFMLVSHTANWEIMALNAGLLIAKPLGTSIYALARPLKNPYLYDYAMRLRGGMGLKTIDKSGGVREAFDRLKENEIVCALVDQRISEGSIETNFFGRPALTTSLPAIAALRFGTPVFFLFLHRTQDLRFVLDVEGPVPIERTGNVHRDIQTNTQKFVDRIETEIRKDPRSWLWMHNRWRLPHGPKD